MVPPPGQSGSQPLPQKEQALFKKIVKCYEHKQYKNGLKLAKQILSNSKLAEHGETLAMKGLILNCMGKVEEARENVKKGLKNDVKSHVCWHVYGLLQRSEKKYDDAIKAYRNALRIDKDNMQILRDLSLLQIQMRDLEGYRDTRYRLLTLRPTQRASWIGYAMAYHFLENYAMALKILDEFRKTQNATGYDFEHSELLLYQNMVLKESGQLSLCLSHLTDNETHIADKLQFLETKAELCMKLGRLDEATDVYRDLIRRNSENLAYYRDLEEGLGITGKDGDSEEVIEKRLELYDAIRKMDPRASAPQRLPLRFLKGARFLERLKPYLLEGLRKCVPPLFNNVRTLYRDPAKVLVIEELMTRWAQWLEVSGRIHDCPGEETDEEAPTTLLWVYFFLAQHQDHLGRHQKALDYLQKASLHTPTLIELSILKAKIYKHAGNKAEAVEWMEEAQSLDTADRYVNSKCAKYMLRADLITEAQTMCSKFTREGNSAMQSLNEMQCMWFETECASAYRRLGSLGESLKKCHEVDRHFTVIVEDQFDFHTYCVRKMTLSAYVRLIRLEDRLKGHRFYYRAAKTAIKIYLRLHDKPDEAKLGLDGVKGEKLNASERRKLVRKMKKQAAKDQNIKDKQPPQKHNRDTDGEPATNEPLLDPRALLKTETPLDEAVKFLMPLIQFRCPEIGAYILGFEVFYRKGKVLPMLQCLKRGWDLDPENPRIHVQRVKFLSFVERRSVEGPVGEILEEEMEKMFSTRDSDKLNQDFHTKHQSSLPHLLAVAQAMWFLDPSRQKEALDLVLSLDQTLTGITWQTCHKILKGLSDESLGTVDEGLIEEYRKKSAEAFPLATSFHADSPECLEDTNHVLPDSKELLEE